MEHYCNNNHRGVKQGISNTQRIRDTYNSNGDQWAIVTGASEGIGRCFAIDLAKSGFNVMIASRSQDKLEKVEKEIMDVNPSVKVRVVPVDLSKQCDAITSDAEVMQNLGILVNNVGHGKPNKFFGQDPDMIATQQRLNLIPITLLTKHAKISFLNQDPKRKFGLIQLASMASDTPFPLITHYGATKRYGEWFAHCINLRNLRKERT